MADKGDDKKGKKEEKEEKKVKGKDLWKKHDPDNIPKRSKKQDEKYKEKTGGRDPRHGTGLGPR